MSGQDRVMIVFGVEMKGKRLSRLVSVPVINDAVREDCAFDAAVRRDASEAEIVSAFRKFSGARPVMGMGVVAGAEWMRQHFSGWPTEVVELSPAADHFYGSDGLKSLKLAAGVKVVPRGDLRKQVGVVAALFCALDSMRRKELEF